MSKPVNFLPMLHLGVPATYCRYKNAAAAPSSRATGCDAVPAPPVETPTAGLVRVLDAVPDADPEPARELALAPAPEPEADG